jgi:hypothetical protein
MNDREGLILQGCGGDPQEWLDGVNDVLTEAGILLDGDKFKDASVFEHDGHTDILFDMDNVKLDVGRLAMWRTSRRRRPPAKELHHRVPIQNHPQQGAAAAILRREQPSRHHQPGGFRSGATALAVTAAG